MYRDDWYYFTHAVFLRLSSRIIQKHKDCTVNINKIEMIDFEYNRIFLESGNIISDIHDDDWKQLISKCGFRQ